MKFRIDQIDANPFRHIDRYPIREDKIVKLRESIRSTSFWDNLVARVVDGRAQIAYGHHRLEALRREYSGDHEVNLIVRDLPDSQMLKIMANENMEEWGSSAMVEHETIRAVVEAYAASQIELEKTEYGGSHGLRESQVRFAPSFILGLQQAGGRAYTAQSIAGFLNWTKSDGSPTAKVLNSLAALAFIEDGTLTESVFNNLTTQQAGAVVEQTRRVRSQSDQRAKIQREAAERLERQAQEAEVRHAAAEKERQAAAERAAQARDDAARRREQQQAEDARRRAAEELKTQREAKRRAETATAREQAYKAEGRREAKSVGGSVSAAMRAGEGYKNARQIAENSRAVDDQPPVQIDVYARKIAAQVHRLFEPDYHNLAKSLDELIRFRKHMSATEALNLSRELSAMAARVEHYRTKLSSTVDEATPDRDPDVNVLDAEIVPDYTMKEITQ